MVCGGVECCSDLRWCGVKRGGLGWGCYLSSTIHLVLLTHSDKNDTLITHLEVGMSMLWTAHRRSPSVHLWDVDQGRAKGQLVCDVIVRKQ